MASASPVRFVRVSFAVLGVLAGCGRLVAEPVPLAGLSGRTLQYTLTDVDSLERDASVGAYRFTLVFPGGTSCVRLEGTVTATLNGQPMHVEPGGVPDTGVGGREVCDDPRATFDFDPDQWKSEPGDLRVTLQDDTHTVRLVLGAGKAKRRFQREGGTPDKLRRGQTQTYVWMPQTDALLGTVQARLIHEDTGISSPLPVRQEGTTVRLDVPAETLTGPYVLRLTGTASGRVLTCEGVAGCDGFLVHSEDLEVSVVP